MKPTSYIFDDLDNGCGRSLLSVAWPTGVQMFFFFFVVVFFLLRIFSKLFGDRGYGHVKLV